MLFLDIFSTASQAQKNYIFWNFVWTPTGLFRRWSAKTRVFLIFHQWKFNKVLWPKAKNSHINFIYCISNSSIMAYAVDRFISLNSSLSDVMHHFLIKRKHHQNACLIWFEKAINCKSLNLKWIPASCVNVAYLRWQPRC